MAGSVLFTLLFAFSGSLPLFTLAWIGNRFVQSLGWVGMVRISSRWFSHHMYGTVMGILSLSFLFGDAVSRIFLAWLIGNGLGWRSIFGIAAGTLMVLFLFDVALLKDTPEAIGEREPEASPLAVVDQHGSGSDHDFWTAVKPPFLDYGFWLVCILSFAFTLVRETFNLWTPTYFVEIGLRPAKAAAESSLFPLFGGFSVLLSGLLSDRLKRDGRATIIFYGLLCVGGTLFLLGEVNFGASPALAVGLVTLVAFLMIGPYSYLAGAVALDLGGKRGSATTSGVIDGVGYLGGIPAGGSVARVSLAYGWRGAFTILAIVVWLASLAALLYLREVRRRIVLLEVAVESCPGAEM
jgi:sugar phosphate permease